MYSVIISSVGRFEYLVELYSSIKNQTLPAKEILFLLDENNFCKENSKKFEWGAECKFIFCKDLNLSCKRNYGAEIATTNYLFFSDDDDIWAPNKAKICLQEIDINPVLIHDFTKFGFKLQKPQLLHGNKVRDVYLNSLLRGSNVWGGGSSIIAKREVVLIIKFKESLSCTEDYEWFTRLLLADIPIKYLPYPLVSYRSHSDNMTKNYRQYLVMLKTSSLFLKKSIYLLYGSSYAIFKNLPHLIFSFFNSKRWFLQNKIK